MAYDTNPDLVIQMMHLVWGLPMPKLLITIQGSNTNFELNPRLGKVLQVGFIKAARTCNAWIFTGLNFKIIVFLYNNANLICIAAGFNEGVTKHIGSALNYDRHSGLKRDSRVVSVGVAPWGLLEHRNELLVKNKDKVYSYVDHARVLNPKHSNFLLVDNGSVGKIGGETYFRRRLEKCIARHSTGRSKLLFREIEADFDFFF
jgi:transient receptor potential cation channel subfamily M protein 3